MQIYCLKCRNKTDTNEVTEIVFKNGVPAVTGKCTECHASKFLITKRHQDHSTGGSLVNTLLNKLPLPEMHLGLPQSVPSEFRPGGKYNRTSKYSYCGPFTKLRSRLDQGYSGVNRLDQACLDHDLAYAASSDVKTRNKADDILANKAAQIVMDSNAPDYEKQDGRLVTGIIAAKSRFGL